MAEKSDFVKVAMEPDRKDRWENAVSDNPNVGTLSGLIRLAVEREIGGVAGNDGLDEEVNESLSELLEEARKQGNRLQAMEARLGSVEQALQKDPEVQKLASEVFAALPTKAQFEEYQDPSQALPDTLPEGEGGPLAYSGSVADVAAVVGSSELQVQQALDKLQADTARLREAEAHDGTPRYYKEV